MGDIYAEIEALKRQLVLQTGRAELPGEGDDIERYKALLNRGAEFGARYNIAPGIALPAEQMQQLTGDTVILVNRQVRLPDGSTREVAMPQLYSKKRAGDIDGRRTHISGEYITGQGGKLENRAILHAREGNDARFSAVDNRGGTITARDLHIHSQAALDNTGGTLQGRRSIDISSDADIRNAASENAPHHSGNPAMASKTRGLNEGRIILDGAGQESEGYLRLYAQGDIDARASLIDNRNAGSRTILSGANILFSTQETETSFTFNGGGESRLGAPARDYLHTRERTGHGTAVKGKGDIILDARQGTIAGTGAQIDSTDGHVTLFARDGIHLANAWHDMENAHSTHSKGKRFLGLGSKENETYVQESAHSAIPGSITGRTVSLVAGRDMSGENTNASADINLTGMHVVSDHGTQLLASRDIHLRAAQETYSNDTRSYQRKSGLFYDLQNPFTLELGNRKWNGTTTTTGTGHAPSVVGALDGNVIISAGNHYQNDGSIVHASRKEDLGPVASKAELEAMSPEARDAYWARRMQAGNVLISARRAEETALLGNHSQNGKHTYESRGLKIGLQGGMIDSANGLVNNIATFSGSDNPRVQALSAGLAAYNLKQGIGQIQNLQNPDELTADGVLNLLQLQPAGKKPMSAQELLNGRADWFSVGKVLM